MFVSYQRVSETGVTAFRADGSAVFIEPGHVDWEAAATEAGPYVSPPEPTPEEIAEQQRAEAQANRQAAYMKEADPLFFKYQRGEATEQEWLDKIEEIRARYPYPEE